MPVCPFNLKLVESDLQPELGETDPKAVLEGAGGLHREPAPTGPRVDIAPRARRSGNPERVLERPSSAIRAPEQGFPQGEREMAQPETRKAHVAKNTGCRTSAGRDWELPALAMLEQDVDWWSAVLLGETEALPKKVVG